MAGVVGLVANEFHVAFGTYVFQFDATTWGWIHLLAGLLVVFAGAAVMFGQPWARVVGIVLAGLSALINFAFVPYYPVWSLLIIGLHVIVIWSLAVDHLEP